MSAGEIAHLADHEMDEVELYSVGFLVGQHHEEDLQDAEFDARLAVFVEDRVAELGAVDVAVHDDRVVTCRSDDCDFCLDHLVETERLDVLGDADPAHLTELGRDVAELREKLLELVLEVENQGQFWGTSHELTILLFVSKGLAEHPRTILL